MKKSKTKAGRKARLTADPSLQEKLCNEFRAGLAVKTACELCAFSETAFFDYLRRGDPTSSDHEPQYLEFAQSVARARAEGHRMLHGIIAAAAPSDWKAASWLLERVAPAEYGRPPDTRAGDKAQNGLLHPSVPAPTINVVYQRDEKSQAIRDKYFHLEE